MTSKLDYIYDSPVFVDLYEILEVEIDARPEEIKKSYLKLSKIHHPDHGGNNEMFQEITKAYEILFSKDSRKEYDLYYLKKNMEENDIDDLLKFKREYKNFVNTNSKPISEDKLSEMYTNFFDNKIKEEVLEEKDLNKRINDINLERETMDIEVEDNTLFNIIKEDENTTINDVFEYIKHTEVDNHENKIIENNIYTLDTLPKNTINYYSLAGDDNNLESTLYSSVQNNINYSSNMVDKYLNNSDINEWKKSKNSDKKLSTSDIDNYLNRRKQEETDIFLNVASELNIKKTSKFLNNTYVSEDIQSTDKTSINNVRKREPPSP
jgi:curved DNA-binding protein CbpA